MLINKDVHYKWMLLQVLHLSGIVALFFTAIAHAHYSYYSVEQDSQVSLRAFFEFAAFLSESFVFIYLGLQAGLLASCQLQGPHKQLNEILLAGNWKCSSVLPPLRAMRSGLCFISALELSLYLHPTYYSLPLNTFGYSNWVHYARSRVIKH